MEPCDRIAQTHGFLHESYNKYEVVARAINLYIYIYIYIYDTLAYVYVKGFSRRRLEIFVDTAWLHCGTAWRPRGPRACQVVTAEPTEKGTGKQQDRGSELNAYSVGLQSFSCSFPCSFSVRAMPCPSVLTCGGGGD